MEEELNNNVEQNQSIKQVEVITKEPVVKNLKIPKDPKKIAAGKKLAVYNKKAREDKKKMATSNSVEEINENDGGGFGFNVPLTTIIAILGLGLTAADLYFRFNEKKGVKDYKTMPAHNDTSVGKKNVGDSEIKSVTFKQGME